MNSQSSLRLILLASLLLAACAPTGKVVTLGADSTLSGGPNAAVKVDVPGGWYQTSAKPTAADFVADDNFSRISVSASPVTAPADSCPGLAQGAAQKKAASLTQGKQIKVDFASAAEAPEIVDFSMTVPASPPGPSDQLVFGRALCRNGALAVATCSVGVAHRMTMGRQCEQVLGTLRVETAQPATR